MNSAATGTGAPRLVVERMPDVLLVGINRPDKRNALDRQMSEELREVLAQAKAEEPRVLVLHSTTPGMFVSGADVNELLRRNADDAMRAINASLFEELEAYRWPTIAAVDGPALGGGCELALACDLRLASTSARFGQPELGLGILAGAGGNWRLPELVGIGLARRMLFAGEQLDADAALAAGLCSAVSEPGDLLAAALALAGQVVRQSWRALELTKLALAAQVARQSWRALELTKLALRLHRPATTTFDIAAQALLFESDDKSSRMEAFLARKKGQP